MSAASDLNSRLAALEAAVEELQSQAGESEALSPNYLSIDPTTGEVGADFTGSVHAQGLTLPAATTGPQPTNQVQWTDTLKRLVAAIWGSNFNPGEELTLLLREADTAKEIATVWLESANSPEIGMRLDSPSGWNPAVSHQTNLMTLNPDGSIGSDFLQNANDLSDLANIATARSNLGIPSSGADWVDVALTAPWVNYGAPYAPARYLKDKAGFVHLSGVIHGGATITTAFTLPVGFRPSYNMFTSAYSSGDTWAAVEVDTNGNVIPRFATAGAAIALDGAYFLAEQ